MSTNHGHTKATDVDIPRIRKESDDESDDEFPFKPWASFTLSPSLLSLHGEAFVQAHKECSSRMFTPRV